MAKFEFEGLSGYVKTLEQLELETDTIIGQAVYEGASVVANMMKAAIYDIPTDERRHVDRRDGITSVQKAGLINSFGISPLRNDNGYINVKLGFDGYNAIGQPNVMIARSVESGTSFMPKFQTFTKATNEAKKKCEETMAKALEEEIKKKGV